MLYISHRGNLTGPNPKTENTPEQIQKAIELNYYVEIDVHGVGCNLYLGHNEPKIAINNHHEFFNTVRLFVHAKNERAFQLLTDLKEDVPRLHYFWHQEDKYTLTSEGLIWTYPGEIILDTGKDIAVKPENHTKPALELLKELERCYGICSDYIADFRKYLDKGIK